MGRGLTYDMCFLLQSAVGIVNIVIGYLLMRGIVSYQFGWLMGYHIAVTTIAALLVVAWLVGDAWVSYLKIHIDLISAEYVITYMHPIFVLTITNALLIGVTADLLGVAKNNTWNNNYALMLFAVGVVTLGCARLPPRRLKAKKDEEIVRSENMLKVINRHENPSSYSYPVNASSVNIPMGDDPQANYPGGVMTQRVINQLAL